MNIISGGDEKNLSKDYLEYKKLGKFMFHNAKRLPKQWVKGGSNLMLSFKLVWEYEIGYHKFKLKAEIRSLNESILSYIIMKNPLAG